MAAIESNSGIEVREDERLRERERERSREEATVCTACSSSGASDSSSGALVRLLVLRCCADIGAAMDDTYSSFEFQI